MSIGRDDPIGGETAGEKSLKTVYPFTAIVDQDQAKAALILNAIDPTIGGVLISGPKGSGKSLLAKSFSQVLPEIEHVADCLYRCSPRDPTNMCPKCLSRFEAGEELPVARTPMKFVQAPLSVTEDMLVGSIDFDKVIKEGERSLRPGLLAEVNQNILYIDEVNLLPDYITDNILDAAASGWNYVEREGFSVQHPSRFILVGTMNPEEGELRPQILDRFGIYAETENIEDPDLRTLIVGRNEEYSSDPTGFASRHTDQLEKLKTRIEGAKRLLTKVQVPKEAFSLVAEACSRLKVDGFRPDIVSVKVARALAAFNGEDAVDPQDMSFSLELALGHRTRRSGMLPPPTKTEIRKAISRTKIPLKVRLKVPKPVETLILVPRQVFDRIIEGALRSYVIGVFAFLLLAASISYFLDTTRVLFAPSPPTPLTILFEVVLGGVTAFIISRLRLSGRKEEVVIGSLDLPKMTVEAQNRLMPSERSLGAGGSAPSKATYRKGVDATPDLGPKILKPLNKASRGQATVRLGQTGRTLRGGGYSGDRRTKVVTSSSRGRYAWYQTPMGRKREVAIVPTLRAASLRQHGKAKTRPRVLIRPEDIRVKVREYKAPFSIILLVDMSLSMIESVENIVETVYSLHTDIYRRRDRVGLIVFKGSRAFTIQHPTRNLDLVVKKLREVGASDFTPLAAGLFEAWKTLKQEKLRNREAIPHLIVVSDGIANVPLEVPLSPLTRRRYTSEAQADSFDVSRLIAKEGFKVHVVNTKHIESDMRAPRIMDEGRRIRMTPTEFLKEVAHITRGNYIGLDPQGVEVGLSTGSGLLRSPFTATPG